MPRLFFSILLLCSLLPLAVAAQTARQTLPPISIYFNKSVDTTLAYPPGNVATGNADLGAIAAQEIGKATASVDMAMYNLNVQSVVDALIAAHQRGVKLRVIAHVENSSGAAFQKLVAAGIPLLANPPGQSGQPQPLMHNKFLAIDARPNAPAGAHPVTLMGSWNATFPQTYNDPNNLLVIRDSAITAAYLMEFEEMWGGQSDTPNVAAAKFGAEKADNTPHTFTVGGTRVDIYFSPSDQTASHINNALLTGETSIYTANLTFTYGQFATTLRRQHDSGADVRCIVDNVDDQGSQFGVLGSFAEAFDWKQEGIFHHKYAVVDAIPLGVGTAPVVVTGSHNFTFSAQTRNDENTAIIHDAAIANQFLQEFAARYQQVGGSTPFVKATVVNPTSAAYSIMLRAYPNPFSSSITLAAQGIEQETTLTISDPVGRTIATFLLEPGQPLVQWNAASVASGSYLARIGNSTAPTMIWLVR